MNIIWLTKLTDSDLFRTTQLGLSEALRRRGHEVTIIFARHFTEKKQSRKNIIYLPIIDSPILSGIIYGIIIFLYLPVILKKRKVDFVIVCGDTIWSPFLITSRLFHTPMILDIRSLPIDKERSILADVSLHLSKYLVDGFTTITLELAEILKNKYHLQDKKIGIWSSGFSKEKFIKSKTHENTMKNINPNMFLLLCHGTYSPTRGIENLIRSIAKLDNDSKRNIKLQLIGIPQNKIKDLIMLCEEFNVAEQIEIIPPVDNNKIPQYIQSCDVGIIPLPPNNEWWRVSVPLKTLEYLAMGKPIIATNIPFHQKIFNIHECGILLKTNNPDDIANAIMFLYNNKEKLIDMGQKGKEIVEKYYTWDHIALDLEQFLSNIQTS